MSAAVFQLKCNTVRKAVTTFKNASIMDNFWEVLDCYLILSEKQPLKQEKNCFIIPWSSFDTRQTYEHTMIREVLGILQLFSYFLWWRQLWTFFHKVWKTIECSCDVEGIISTISTHYQSKFVKNSKFYRQGSHLSPMFLGLISHSEVTEQWHWAQEFLTFHDFTIHDAPKFTIFICKNWKKISQIYYLL